VSSDAGRPFEAPAAPAFDRAWSARLRSWAATWGREAPPFAAIAAVGLVMRLVALDVKPMHHDESEHAWFAMRMLEGQGYTYDPVFHGPVQFYLIGIADLLVGMGDFAARLPAAILGTVAVFLPFFLRRQLGTIATLTASVALCLSPSYLYQSRFAREDIHIATINLAILVVLIRFFDAPRRWQPVALLALLATAFATKETTYITVFLLVLFLLGVIAVEGVRERRQGSGLLDGDTIRSATSLGAATWAWAASAFLVIYTLLFSTFFTSPRGLREGLVGSIHYWLSQQPVGRGGQPWWYYLMLGPAYEWPIIILGFAGIVVVLRRPTVTGALLLWMFVGTLAVFSWASERMPWLILHPLLPLILLAGLGTQALWEARRRRGAQAVLAVAAIAAVGWAYSSIRLSYFHAADARELLVQVQTSDDVPKIRDELVRIEALASKSPQWRKQPLVLQIDSWGGVGWPWSWYLRDVPSGYYDMSHPELVQPGPVVLVSDPNHAAMAPKLKGYVARRFRLRVWWVPDWRDAGAGDLARWAARRTPWNPTATMDEWLYLRPDIARLAARSPRD